MNHYVNTCCIFLNPVCNSRINFSFISWSRLFSSSFPQNGTPCFAFFKTFLFTRLWLICSTTSTSLSSVSSHFLYSFWQSDASCSKNRSLTVIQFLNSLKKKQDLFYDTINGALIFGRQATETKHGIFFCTIINPWEFSVPLWIWRPVFLIILVFKNSKLVGWLLVNMLIEIFSIETSSVSFFCCCFCLIFVVKLSALL